MTSRSALAVLLQYIVLSALLGILLYAAIWLMWEAISLIRRRRSPNPGGYLLNGCITAYTAFFIATIAETSLQLSHSELVAATVRGVTVLCLSFLCFNRVLLPVYLYLSRRK